MTILHASPNRGRPADGLDRALPPVTRFRLSALHAAAFVQFGIALPFLPVWLASRGLAPSTIGLVLAGPIVTRILVTAPLMTLVDGRVGPRLLLAASHAAMALAYGVLLLAEGALAIGIVIALAAVAQAVVVPGNDVVTLDAVRRRPDLSYSRLRVWGSISFLAASLAAGILVQRFGPGVVGPLLAVVPLLGLAATLGAVPHRLGGEARPGGERAATEATRRDAGLPRALWFAIAAAACIQATHASLYTFGSLHWRSLGFPDALIGALWAVGVVAEILLFSALGAVTTARAAFALLGLGAVAALIRFPGLALDPGLAPTFVLQALHGLTFGAMHLGSMAILSLLAPEGARGRAQGLLAAALALVTAAATLACGPLYTALGRGLFLAMVPLALIGLAFVALAWRAQQKGHNTG
ncbi:MAG TPA: MFS transporter [Beijerinckiaceae bacterium]|jgi:PPP family 3-phenylpropionic acid transporter